MQITLPPNILSTWFAEMKNLSRILIKIERRVGIAIELLARLVKIIPKAFSAAMLLVFLGLGIFSSVDFFEALHYGDELSKWTKDLGAQDEFKEKIYNSEFYNHAIPLIIDEDELAYIQKSRPGLYKILPPEWTYFSVGIEDIFNLYEINDTVFISGEITAIYDRDTAIGPVHLLNGSSPENLLDFFQPNFIDLDGAIYEPALVSRDDINNIYQKSETYKFGGRFRANINHKNFPFDTLSAEISFSSLFPLIDLNIEFEDVYVMDGRHRLNSFIAQKADCREEGNYGCGWIDNSAYQVLDDIENDDLNQKKESYARLLYAKMSTLVIELPYRRAIGSSFFRYISPVAFVLLVALLFDYLDDDEAWESQEKQRIKLIR